MLNNLAEVTKNGGRNSDQMLLTSSECKIIEDKKTLTIEEERIEPVQT